MADAISIAAWIMCGLGLLAALGGKMGIPKAAIGVFLGLAAILGGVSIVISRRLELAGRFGGRVPITGTAAVLFGLGMIVAPIGAGCFALATRIAPAGRVWGGMAIVVLGAGLALTGTGMWIKFALEPWHAARGETMARRVPMLILRTWSFGWIGLIGAALMVGGFVIAIKAL